MSAEIQTLVSMTTLLSIVLPTRPMGLSHFLTGRSNVGFDLLGRHGRKPSPHGSQQLIEATVPLLVTQRPWRRLYSPSSCGKVPPDGSAH
jgi:hypothetical protein